jgi:hypothetical protein
MKKKITAEDRARWAEARREVEAQIAKIDARRLARAEAEERRVRRLRRLTFGLLPRY